MNRDTLLVVMTATASGFCWWPVIMQPNLDFPFWSIPLLLVAGATAFSTTLSYGSWLRFVVATFCGASVGAVSGFLLWWPIDRIEASFVPLIVISVILASSAVSLLAGLVLRKVTISNSKLRRTVWLTLVCLVAFGPIVAALTPSLVAERMARNERITQKRMVSLSTAATQTLAEIAGPKDICDGTALKRHYFGPAFNEKDWRYIVGNYVTQDGYEFSIYCHEKTGYVIDARPHRERGDGLRKFCADESGAIGCDLKWYSSRRVCVPCMK